MNHCAPEASIFCAVHAALGYCRRMPNAAQAMMMPQARGHAIWVAVGAVGLLVAAGLGWWLLE